MSNTGKEPSVMETLIATAIRDGAELVEVEYRNGIEEVYAVKSGLGVAIALLPSTGKEAQSLREDLYALRNRKRRLKVDNVDYELRVQTYENFGEWDYRVDLRRLTGAPSARRSARGAGRRS